MALQIIEVLGRSDQGMTKPFICRAENDEIFFVKGRGAGRRSLLCEWIASNLASLFGLPVPPFEIVEIPPELVQISVREDMDELGAGYAFASKRLFLTELTISNMVEIPITEQRDVFAFDWWIRNGDRNLSDRGGNPNLFWDVAKNRLVVLDHNQAFDKEFSVERFIELHAFRQMRQSIAEDWVIQDQLDSRLSSVLGSFDVICERIPHAWWFIDDEQTIPVDFERDDLKASLQARCGNQFWSFT